jgi:hypothetical protein
VIHQVYGIYVVRTLVTLLSAPLILAPVGLALLSNDYAYAFIMQFLPETYFFMFTWGLFTHVFCVRRKHTKLQDYLIAYLCCGVPASFLLAGFTFELTIFLGLFAGLLVFSAVPVVAWYLYYKLLFRLEF